SKSTPGTAILLACAAHAVLRSCPANTSCPEEMSPSTENVIPDARTPPACESTSRANWPSASEIIFQDRPAEQEFVPFFSLRDSEARRIACVARVRDDFQCGRLACAHSRIALANPASSPE